jgi:hypothetical protein
MVSGVDDQSKIPGWVMDASSPMKPRMVLEV